MGAAGVLGRDIGYLTWPTAGRPRCHTDRMPRRAATDGGGTDPPATLRSQHVEATRHAVLAAARSLFGQKGYAQTSVDEIAAAARVTKGAVYHHFASKVALFRAVYAEVEAEAQARTAEAVDPNGSPIDQIVAGVNAYLDVALDAEIQRITLVDGPAVLGLEPEGPTEQQAGYVALRFFMATAIAHGHATAASRSTCRWERTRGRCPREQTDRPPRWPGCCPTASNCSRSKTPRWSSTTRPAGCFCSRWLPAIQGSGEWAAWS